MMKRKFPHNFQTGQIDNIVKNSGKTKARSNYSNVNGNSSPYQYLPKIDRNKSTHCYLNSSSTLPNNLNSKNTKKVENTTKKLSNSLYQKIQNENQSKRPIDSKKEKNESGYSSTKINPQQCQEYLNKKEINSSTGQLDERKKIVGLKKSHVEVGKNAFSVEESITVGIKMQLIYSLLCKSEFQSLTQLIFHLLSEKPVGLVNKTDKSKCILFLDYLILRTKKLSYIVDSLIQDRSILLKALEKDKQDLRLFIKNIKNTIYEKIVDSKNIQSFWHKCDVLSEELNLIKNKKNIQNEIEEEYESYNEIKSLTKEKRINLNGKKKSIYDICLLLSRLISKY
ncbi:unnamed protein product [Cryptosporidium hominis]|uniref:Uncharacterized protein n=2 Tax=Cryptosporidium hominis TaxID=237895 RepID=A0A0S4TG74_CRYHO|nr:hypothetical protein [Cryptosporidium hominis TU502]CUV06127.1 unnamed protein product [Cryptosporidium hominis]